MFFGGHSVPFVFPFDERQTLRLGADVLIRFFRKLCESPYLESIDWARWHVFWADERVVKKDHPDSNYKLAWDGLLSKVTTNFLREFTIT